MASNATSYTIQTSLNGCANTKMLCRQGFETASEDQSVRKRTVRCADLILFIRFVFIKIAVTDVLLVNLIPKN